MSRRRFRQRRCDFTELLLVKAQKLCYNGTMKKFWCLFLIALLLIGCARESDAPIGLMTPAPQTPETVESTAVPEDLVPPPAVETPPAKLVRLDAKDRADRHSQLVGLYEGVRNAL